MLITYMGTKINDRFIAPFVLTMNNIKSKLGSRRKMRSLDEDQQRASS